MSFLFPMRPSVPRALPPTPDDYLLQIKYDDWNIVVSEGHVWTRHGNEITFWCADWGFDLAPAYPVNGELLARADNTASHRSDIPGIRTGRRRPFVLAFDLMLEGPPIEERLHMLRGLASDAMEPALTTDPLQDDASWGEVNLMLEDVKAKGHEGLILKRKHSPYLTSREISIITVDWLKLKVPVEIAR